MTEEMEYVDEISTSYDCVNAYRESDRSVFILLAVQIVVGQQMKVGLACDSRTRLGQETVNLDVECGGSPARR